LGITNMSNGKGGSPGKGRRESMVEEMGVEMQ